jgi:hypothetical protein
MEANRMFATVSIEACQWAPLWAKWANPLHTIWHPSLQAYFSIIMPSVFMSSKRTFPAQDFHLHFLTFLTTSARSICLVRSNLFVFDNVILSSEECKLWSSSLYSPPPTLSWNFRPLKSNHSPQHWVLKLCLWMPSPSCERLRLVVSHLYVKCSDF